MPGGRRCWPALRIAWQPASTAEEDRDGKEIPPDDTIKAADFMKRKAEEPQAGRNMRRRPFDGSTPPELG